jgi:transcriptional regulator with XRE-family HTH domain
MHWTERIASDYGITMYQLSESTGVSRQFLSNCKRRNTPIDRINAGLAAHIAEYLNMTVEELLEKYA